MLLDDVRVVDLGDAVGEAAARLLADLGADTVKIEPPGGSPLRHQEPVVDGVSLPFAVRNANKRSVSRDSLCVPQLLADADIAFLTPQAFEEFAPLDHLVVVLCSPFGRTGPRSDWQATPRTLLALNGSLSRSGRPGSAPLLPPEGIVEATAAAHAAWTALVAYRTGGGQVIDLSHQEALVTGLDPAFGAQGSAAAGRSGKLRRGRPPADVYPVYRCTDGFVRLCLLSGRQWRGMFSWLGEPAEFADPAYESIAARVAAADRLEPLITALFAARQAAELVDEAARRGVPLAQVLTLGEALASDHFTAAGTVASREIAPGVVTRLPVGFADVDGHRLGIRTPSPAVPVTDDLEWRPRGAPVTPTPFSELRVLDLGVIVFGAEAGRAFADFGADVIKIESTKFPDGLRQTRRGEPMNASFAWGNRGKRSLGLDLRSNEGQALFEDLVRHSDVVLANFKPGTLDSLGIGYDHLAALNPGIIVLESAAFSAKGPWANRLGYGPLVRAACGVTSLWKYAPDDVESWDGVTVYPDHVAAKLGALTVAAALLARDRTGRGAHLEIAQSDVVLHQFAALAALEGLRRGAAAAGNADTVFACAGDDEWCVIDTPEDDGDHLAKWAAGLSPAEVTESLQAQGIPAAPMVRLPELLDDPQLHARQTFTTMRHPLLEDELPAENVAAPFSRLTSPAVRPAPMSGEHTAEICTEVLGLTIRQVDDLIEKRVLHDAHPRAAEDST
ncbi:CoA transferase [Amycolatopsis stemonae]